MKIRCLFRLPNGELAFQYVITWSNRRSKTDFALDADDWLKRGPGYRVETEAV